MAAERPGAGLRRWADRVKRDAVAVHLAARDPRVPLGAKILAVLIAAYVVSPIDLIPDFIPVIGYLDDLILVPLGLLLVVRLIPRDVMAELRAEAATRCAERGAAGRVAGAVIVVLWGGVAAAVAWWAVDRFAGG